MGERPDATERHKELFRLFQMAIQSEKAAQQLYLAAKEKCDDPELKEILDRFHQEEAKHEAVLLEKYKEYRGRFAPDED